LKDSRRSSLELGTVELRIMRNPGRKFMHEKYEDVSPCGVIYRK